MIPNLLKWRALEIFAFRTGEAIEADVAMLCGLMENDFEKLAWREVEITLLNTILAKKQRSISIRSTALKLWRSDLIHSLTTDCDSFAQKTDSGIEFWLARDLQQLLGYSKWENFLNVLSKAKTACEVIGKWCRSGHRQHEKLTT